MLPRKETEIPIHEHLTSNRQFIQYALTTTLKDQNKLEIDKYKLHIAIHPGDFDEVNKKIHALLQQALQKGTIVLYKVYNVVNERKVNNPPLSKLRALHHPFTIYLYDNASENNFAQIAKLCEQIEFTLINQRLNKREYRTPCDLPLSSRVTFRQATLDNKYVSATTNDESTLLQLKIEGENSEHYKLCKLLMPVSQSMLPVSLFSETSARRDSMTDVHTKGCKYPIF